MKFLVFWHTIFSKSVLLNFMNTAKLVESNNTRQTSNDAILAEILPIKTQSLAILFYLCIAAHFVFLHPRNDLWLAAGSIRAKSNMTRRLLKQRGIINVAVQLPCTAIVNEIDTPVIIWMLWLCRKFWIFISHLK